MTEVVQSHGYEAERHAHKALNTGVTNNISGQIKQNVIACIWSEFPIPSMHVANDHYHAHITQLCTWARLCYDTGTLFVLYGSVGRKWRNAQLEALCDDNRLHRAYHRLCAFGLKTVSSQTEPSSACFLTLSTRHFQNHPCKCKETRTTQTVLARARSALAGQSASSCPSGVRSTLVSLHMSKSCTSSRRISLGWSDLPQPRA